MNETPQVTIGLPKPICEGGYPRGQLRDILGGDRLDRFEDWMTGQTLMVCEGRRYSHETGGYEPCCGGTAHGIVAYPWDLRRFLAGLPVID